MYVAPFQYLIEAVKPERAKNRVEEARDVWWRLWCPRPEMRKAISGLSGYIATSIVAKHRLFVVLPVSVLPSNKVVAIVRNDDVTLGVLSSNIHLIWAERISTRHGVGNDPSYNPQTCFQTFPFPEGLTPNFPASAYADDPRAQRIADAARALVEARDRWLNPPEWVDRIPEVVPGYPDRIVAKPGFESELKKRTLTNLYNARPAWLDHLHRDLDVAVAAAYGWEWPLSDDDILKRLFELNRLRSAE